MDEWIDLLEESSVFSTLDTGSRYWKVETNDEVKDKTTSTFGYGLYRFTQILFWLKNIPDTFQREMDMILVPEKWQTDSVYLEEILMFSKMPEKNVAYVKQVLA